MTQEHGTRAGREEGTSRWWWKGTPWWELRTGLRAEELESRSEKSHSSKTKPMGDWIHLNEGSCRHLGKTLGVKPFCKHLPLSKKTKNKKTKNKKTKNKQNETHNSRENITLEWKSTKHTSDGSSTNNLHIVTLIVTQPLRHISKETVPCDSRQCMHNYWTLETVCVYPKKPATKFK